MARLVPGLSQGPRHGGTERQIPELYDQYGDLMKQPRPGPDPKNRRRPFGTKRKSCSVSRSDRYIVINADEIWGGVYFSRTGLAVHAPRVVSLDWIGASVRKALETSSFHIPPDGSPLNREERITMEEVSTARHLAFWDEIAANYDYKNREAAWKKYDHVFVSWFYETEPNIVMKASKSSRGGNSAWLLNENAGRIFEVPFTASDTAIGETVLQALAKCEGPGKSTEPLFP